MKIKIWKHDAETPLTFDLKQHVVTFGDLNILVVHPMKSIEDLYNPSNFLEYINYADVDGIEFDFGV